MTEAPACRIAPPAFLSDPALTALLDLLPEARIAGGAVRDSLVGREAFDIDLASPLPPEAVTARLTAAGVKVVPTGLTHGTVTAVLPDRTVEITTLRHDVETDGRHAVVSFTTDWRADAARRDFTINAMSMGRDGSVFDYFGGLDDLRAGRLRFVGDPRERVAEDYLRVLRFFRFYARYGAEPPDAATRAALRDAAPRLSGLSVERVWSELSRILAVGGGVDPDRAILPVDGGAGRAQANTSSPGLSRGPEAAPCQPGGPDEPGHDAIGSNRDAKAPGHDARGTDHDGGGTGHDAKAAGSASGARHHGLEHTIAMMDELGILAAIIPEGADPAALTRLIARGAPPDPLLRTAALLAGDALAFATRLKLSIADRDRLVAARTGPVPPADADDDALRRLLADIPLGTLLDRCWLVDGDRSAVRARLTAIPRPVLPLEGRDIVALGVPPGPEVGALLRTVRAWWLQGGCLAPHDACLAEARRHLA